MRILIDVLHPAHVHVFAGFRLEMLEKGYEILVTARDKEVTLQLLEERGIPHQALSKQRSGAIGLARELVQRTRQLATVVKTFRPDVMTGIMGPSIAPLGRLKRIPSVVFYDTELARNTNTWVYPLASAVCTPDSYTGRVRGNHVTYPGYQELAYLHPNRFTPDRSRLAAYGIEPPYSFVRFVSWEASHDKGDRGLSLDKKRMIIDRLAEHGRVVVSSEGPLPSDLEPHRMAGPAGDVHHVMAYAQVFAGESRTMASEAALLGTPSILVVRRSAGVIADQERYGLLRRFHPRDFEQVVAAIEQALASDGARAVPRQLLEDKVDVTEWMVAFFERRGWERKKRR